MDLISKENEYQIIEMPIYEFNEWLKENDIGWKVNFNCCGVAMDMENYGNPHEPFSFTMLKKYDINVEKCVYKEINGEKFPGTIVFQFSFNWHNDIYKELLNCDKSDKLEYKRKVKEAETTKNISRIEALCLLDLANIEY